MDLPSFHLAAQLFLSTLIMRTRRSYRDTHDLRRLRQTPLVIKNELQYFALSARQLRQRLAHQTLKLNAMNRFIRPFDRGLGRNRLTPIQ